MMQFPNPCSDTHALAIKPQLEQIEVALDWLRGLATQHEWPERAVFGLILSADEALTNIVAHAGNEDDVEEATIRLICRHLPGEIVLRIEDQGRFFDPTGAESKPLAESLEDTDLGGHGLRLMRHYLKSLQYARQDNRNVLTLVMSLSNGGKQADPLV
ncbi:ATP-binding protein [Ottowia thiooxydans]|uniref:Serine/threonine-protein kinase RsbW n=1 Tax=Ottowia thiooxydans TaxID=219182 RepID=A0ABV2QH14_9BURK